MYNTDEEEQTVRELKELLEAQHIPVRDWQKVTFIAPMRESSSMTLGPEFSEGKPQCRPCGHPWYEHDDDGCLWNLCACGLPGERK